MKAKGLNVADLYEALYLGKRLVARHVSNPMYCRRVYIYGGEFIEVSSSYGRTTYETRSNHFDPTNYGNDWDWEIED